jgi:hypothetical protein
LPIFTVELVDKPGETDPKPKTVKIGNEVVFDSTLEGYKRAYEEYVKELAETLREDRDFANIIQFK